MVSPARPSRESITLSSMLAQNGHFTRGHLLAVVYHAQSRAIRVVIPFPVRRAWPAWRPEAERPLLPVLLLCPFRAIDRAKILREAAAARPPSSTPQTLSPK